ncbi:hypothetical protein IU501_07295 [Nocardia otitidiscaviarum]|uniref:hypothetical protein n=1 Tax=Nocardia otitidiscaviarum TaxID=1823 RepID=UPI0018959FD7|nr:hypothetical protein [Nocardia otitidiscaviarum]MBF6132807.1 hypothetical protein [Nocardia otitidiscaviarum]
MIDQIVPMVGVVLGSLTTYLGTAWAERVRYQRLLATRWDQHKLDVYAEYASAVKDMLRAAGRHADARDRGVEELAVLRAELESSDNRRSTVFERLVLLGDPAVTEAAKTANRLVLEAKRISTEISSTSEQRLRRGDEVVAALNSLHQAARIDLGIPRPIRGQAIPTPAD